jgi:pyruvate/2-oxoglutarate dehydrogenase complex dihydrolipoamide acyltransferase (E2) component
MTDVTVPEHFWDDDSEGVVSAWLFVDGEIVVAGVPLAEIMYEKASMELLAPANGVLRIVAPAESAIKRGQVIARIES